MTTTTLDFLDDLADLEAVVQEMYDKTVSAANFRNPPELFIEPLTGGRAGLFDQIDYTISVDPQHALHMSEPLIYGMLAHELAHANVGAHNKHNPTHQRAEDEIIDRMRCHGLTVTRAPDQGGMIRADDWRSWLWLLSWSIPLFLAFPALLLALAYWRH